MKNEQFWIGLAATILLTFLGFLGISLYNMNANLSSVSEKVSSTNKRVDRIANVLPEVRAKVAWEETNHPIEGFLLTSSPQQINDKTWFTKAAVYDRETSQLSIYTIHLNDNNINYPSHAIAGKFTSENPYDASLSQLQMYSETYKEFILIPSNINSETSFVFRSDQAEIMNEYLRNLSDSEPRVQPTTIIKNWQDLSEQLDALSVELDKINKE